MISGSDCVEFDNVEVVRHAALIVMCRVGEKVVVQGVSDDDAAKLRELDRRGLVPGTPVEVVGASEYEGPIDIRIRGRRLSVPLGLARALFVERR